MQAIVSTRTLRKEYKYFHEVIESTQKKRVAKKSRQFIQDVHQLVIRSDGSQKSILAMASSNGSYQDATGSRVPLRTKSPQRILSPHVGATPPTAQSRTLERDRRQPKRISSNRTSSTSSVYLPIPISENPETRTLKDPIMTITSAASVNHQQSKNQVSGSGYERVKKLEEGLKHCLASPLPRRIVSESGVARGTRAGRMIENSGREVRESKKALRPKRAGSSADKWKEVDEVSTLEVEGSEMTSAARLSVPDRRIKDRSVDETVVSGPRRAISLHAESRSQWSVGDGIGIRRLSWLGRRKLVEWGMGVYPRIVYASDSTSGSEDGLGGGLTGTVLCRMGSEHRVWDVVRRGQKFVVRVVGSFTSDVEDVVVYSMVGNGRSRIHSRRTGSGFVGVADRAGRVCDEKAGDVITVCVGVSAGGREVIAGEIRWRLGGDEDVARSGAVLLRFGYYFFLREATGVRLYTTTHTPEHVRLVARRAGDGSIDEHFSSSLTYVVVRVAAD